MGTDIPRTSRHRGRTVLISIFAAILVLALAAGGYGVWTVHRSFPTLSGHIDVSGLHRDVAVYRDAAGIPQIVAENATDLFMAQGYVQAQDRFWEMDFRRHTTAGRLSELFGKSQIGTDTFIRTLGWREVAEKEVKLLDPVTLGYYQAYADGVNAYLATHSGAAISLEYAVLALQNPGYKPEKWTPADSVSWLKAMAWDLRSNLEDEIDRAELALTLPAEQVAELHPGYPYETHPTITGGPAAAPAAVGLEPLSSDDGTSAAAADSTAASTSASASASGELAALAGLRTTLKDIPELLGQAGADIGSNSWVVSGKYTSSGLPILANDPHLGAVMPSVWYQMGLRCEKVSADCPFDVAGYTFSGLPGVVIGHNQSIAWGFTNLGPDVTDLYLEKVTGDTYELDGAQVPLATHTEKIKVAGGDPVTITIRATGRGPLVTDITSDFSAIADGYPKASSQPDGDYELSMQWTALTPGKTASAVFALDAANDFDGFRQAASLFDVPAQNLVYADTKGNIGYQAPGRIPIRKTGDGTVPLPGWTSANGWAGWIPFASLPEVYNPDAGYIVTANNAAAPADSPLMITKDWDDGYRAQEITTRIRKVIESGKKFTTATMSAIQADDLDPMGAQLAPIVGGLKLSGDAAKGAELLAAWNHRDTADSAAAAFYNMTWRHLLEAMFADKLSSETSPAGSARWFSVVGNLLDQPDSPWWTNEKLGVHGRDEMLAYAAEQAWAEGVDAMGSDADHWSWGELHTLELTNATFGTSGIAPIEWLFNRGPYAVDGSSSLVNAIGWDARDDSYDVTNVPSMRQVISLEDFDDSTWVNLTGESGHAFHPNYTDQTPLWQHHETRAWAFSPAAAIQDAATHTLVLKARR